MHEAPSGPREYYRGALREVYGYSPFTQPAFLVIELDFQVADEQRRLALRGYDGRVVRLEGNSTWCEGVGMSLTYTLKRTGEFEPTCATPLPACHSQMT